MRGVSVSASADLTPREPLLDASGAREVSLEIGGAKTALLEAGDGRPLVLLHGMTPAGGLVWWAVLPLLAERFRVIVPDVPGLGESRPLRGVLDRERVAGWLSEVIELRCPEPPLLVATSLGAGFGLHFALTRTAQLRGLVVTDAVGLARFKPPVGFLVNSLRNATWPGPKSLRRLLPYVVHDERAVSRRHGERWEAFLEYSVARARRSGVQKALRQLASRANAKPLPRSKLRDLDIPVRMIWGRHDRPFPLSIAEEGGAALGWPLQVIDDAGHLPYIEQPEAFAEAVL
jgi:pimeloyl-ACP methyl ester carboxylesterase